jgi:hypothetical protein
MLKRANHFYLPKKTNLSGVGLQRSIFEKVKHPCFSEALRSNARPFWEMLAVRPWPPMRAEMPRLMAFKPEARKEFDAFAEAEAHSFPSSASRASILKLTTPNKVSPLV